MYIRNQRQPVNEFYRNVIDVKAKMAIRLAIDAGITSQNI